MARPILEGLQEALLGGLALIILCSSSQNVDEDTA